MFFLFDFPIITITLACLCLLFLIVAIWYVIARYHIIPSFCKKEANDKIEYIEDQPGVSVIVYASNDAENLERNLQAILHQDYPKFEVIVVNDSTTDDSIDYITTLEAKYSNLYQTFVPTDTCNLSSKKLAITLGIKAAKYDYILNTSAHCSPNSDKWIANMMRNFTPETELVIGYTHPDYQEDTSRGNLYRKFEHITTAIQYLSYAIKNKAYRGDGKNIAYRKSTFFKHKGFSRSLNLHSGEDDIFINSVATPTNTRVELSEESQLTFRCENYKRAWKEAKLRYDFTAKYLHTSSFIWANIFMISWWGTWITVAATIFSDYQNYYTLLFGLTSVILLLIIVIVMFLRNTRYLNAPKMCFSLPFLIFASTFVNIKYRLIGRSCKENNYTWQHKK